MTFGNYYIRRLVNKIIFMVALVLPMYILFLVLPKKIVTLFMLIYLVVYLVWINKLVEKYLYVNIKYDTFENKRAEAYISIGACVILILILLIAYVSGMNVEPVVIMGIFIIIALWGFIKEVRDLGRELREDEFK